MLIVAMPGKITHIWVGTFLDKRGNFIDGCQGSEHDIERWKAQFSFGETQKFIFKNLNFKRDRSYLSTKPSCLDCCVGLGGLADVLGLFHLGLSRLDFLCA